MDFTSLSPALRADGLFLQAYSDVERAAAQISASANEQFGPVQKVRVVASFTSSFMLRILRLALLRRGLACDVEEAPYGTFFSALMDPDGPANDGDLTFVLPTHRDLQFVPALGTDAQAAAQAEDKEAEFWFRLLKGCRGQVVMLGFDAPRFRTLGEQDGVLPGGVTRHARRLNAALAQGLPPHISLVDVEALQARIGYSRWHDERLYQLCKQPYAMDAIPELADTLAAAAAGLAGKARKVLVLDLDNTLWGGVIGDIGMDQIAIGPETADGEAFTAFQHYCRSLMRRGVVLAVCSKNHDEFAREPFRNHPAMILREDDIACFVANFDDKASNIRRIARTLNVGLDALVFVDDNPVERELVASELPEVLVVDLDEDPALYAMSVEAAKAFPLAALTSEDLDRAKSYHAVAQLAAAAETGTDLGSFLQGLEPSLTVEAVPMSVARIAQLVAKTNQFKLNPRLFTEAEILDVREGVLALRLQDRLQDYGIVAVVVTRQDGSCFLIENWVMSCRVFSRRLEYATIELIVARAKAMNLDKVMLQYVPSAKNIIIPGLLRSLGFVEDDNQQNRFVRLVDQPFNHDDHFMSVIDGSSSL